MFISIGFEDIRCKQVVSLYQQLTKMSVQLRLSPTLIVASKALTTTPFAIIKLCQNVKSAIKWLL